MIIALAIFLLAELSYRTNIGFIPTIIFDIMNGEWHFCDVMFLDTRSYQSGMFLCTYLKFGSVGLSFLIMRVIADKSLILF